MRKAIYLAVFLTVIASGIIAGSMLITKNVSLEDLPGSDGSMANLMANQQFCVEFKPSGSSIWQDYGCKKNTITTAGLNYVELLLGVGANSPAKYLALGNGTTVAVGDTTLNNEQTDCGLARATGTYYDLGNGWWEINNTYTYSCSVSRVVNTTANFNASSSGTLYAGGTISTVTFTTSGDQLKLRHNFTFAEG